MLIFLKNVSKILSYETRKNKIKLELRKTKGKTKLRKQKNNRKIDKTKTSFLKRSIKWINF